MPLLDTEPPPKHLSLSIPSSLSCRTPTSVHENPPVINIKFNNALPVILPVVLNPYILLCLQYGFFLFFWIFLQHIHLFILIKALKTKYGQTHTLFEHTI